MERNEKITTEAKAIMDNFVQALSQAEVESEKYGVERTIQTRKPQQKKGSTAFREKMFSNASNHTEEYIVAEKKKW